VLPASIFLFLEQLAGKFGQIGEACELNFYFSLFLQPTFGSWTNERIDRSASAPFSLSRRRVEIQAHGSVALLAFLHPSRLLDEANDLFSVDIHAKTSCYATFKSGTVLMDFLKIFICRTTND
jgi:hypothetical protein